MTMAESYVHWLRERLGTRKIILPFSTVIVRDENGFILLQQRTDFEFWGLPGGILELDEDFETCARRELLEETGLEVGVLSFVGIYTDPRYDVVYPNGDEVQQFTICFEAFAEGGQMMPDGVETIRQAFFDPKGMEKLHIPIWYRDMIIDACEGDRPEFRPPNRLAETFDQTPEIRSKIGHALYSGMRATVIITRGDNRFLLIQDPKKMIWLPPSDFCHIGENAAYTAVRATLEKTGYHIVPERIIAVYSTPKLKDVDPQGDQLRNVGVVFRATLNEQFSPGENLEPANLAWVTKDEALQHVDQTKRWFYQKVIDRIDHGFYIC